MEGRPAPRVGGQGRRVVAVDVDANKLLGSSAEGAGGAPDVLLQQMRTANTEYIVLFIAIRCDGQRALLKVAC